MTLKDAINEIFRIKTGYAHPEHAVDQAESLNALSTDLYTDSKRFVYELIQNADDSATKANEQKITVALRNDFLIVTHTGKPFDKRDVEGICGINNGSKKRDAQKTGYKGIGFKAVFGKSECVLIYTNGEYFRFDSNFAFDWNSNWGGTRATWEREKDRKFTYPWQIAPIWTEEQDVPVEINEYVKAQKCTVATIVRLKNPQEAKDAIIELQSQSNMFLFLRNVNEVSFQLATPKILFLKEDVATGIKEIRNESDLESCWLLKRIELNVPLDVIAKLQAAGSNVPEKLKAITKTELIFAAKIKDGEITSLAQNESLLYSFLPTDIRNYYFPVLINASFLTNANREQLHVDSSWNQWLFEQTAIELFKWISVLIKSSWKFQGYRLLPTKLNQLDLLASAFNRGFDHALKEIGFILNTTDQLLTTSEALIDFTPLHKTTFAGSEVIKQYVAAINPGITLNLNPFMPYTTFGNPLKKLGVKTFEWKDIPKLLSHVSFTRQHDHSKNILLLEFLKEKSGEEGEDRPISKANLKDWQFIFDHKSKLQKPEDIYFPPAGDTNWNDPNSELSFVHPNLITWLSSHIDIKIWLESLGVQERTDLTYLRKTIIPNAESYIKATNAIGTIQWLFTLYQKEQIGKAELIQLQDLKLLTKNGSLLSAKECYFSDVYKPRVEFENDLQKDTFLTPEYIIEKTSVKEWKRFFSFMGVKEGIEIESNDNTLQVRDLLTSTLYDLNYFDATDKKFTPFINTFKADEYRGIKTLYLLRDITSYAIAKKFWQDVISNIDLSELSKNATAFWGNAGYPGRQTGDPVANYVVWHVKNIACLPTTEGTISTPANIFLNTTKVIELASNYLPIFDLGVSGELSSDWKSFFKFKTELALRDYFTILNKIALDLNERGKVKQENKTKIQSIYEHFLSALTNWSSDEIDIVRESCKNLLFLADDDTFKNPSDLRYYMDGDSSIFQGTFQFIHLTKPVREHPNLKTMLSYFGVETLHIDSFGLKHKNEEPASELKSKLIQIAPYIAKWVDHDKTREYEQVLYEVERQLNDKSFYEADTLELTYADKTLKRVNLYHREKTIHVTRPWRSGMVMKELPRKLCTIFDLPSYEKEITLLLVENIDTIRDYFIQESIELPQIQDVQTGSETEQLEIEVGSSNFSQTIDYDALKKLVEKENKELLKGLGDDPIVLLVEGIEKQNSIFKGYVYHFTHLENMSSILKDGILKSRANAVFKDSASHGAISHTITEKKDYVRFYFRPKTPTQYYNENFGRGDSMIRLGSEPVCPVPVFLKIPIEEILSQTSLQWEVSLGNMAKTATEYGNSTELIKRFDFNGVYLEKDSGFHGRYFASSQQEFLVKNQLPLSTLSFEILCQDEATVRSLKAMLGKGHPLINKIGIDLTLFYGNNCKININESNEFLTAYLSDKRTGEMILQYSTTEPIHVEGDINATYEVHDIKTIYSKGEIYLQGDLDKVKFSLYYLFNGQLWLIHTNQKETKYNLEYLRKSFPLLYSKEKVSKFEVIHEIKNDPLLKYWYSKPIGGVDKLNLEEHTLQVIDNFERFFSGKSKLIFKETHFKILLALHDIGKPKAVSENEKEKQHEYSLGFINYFFNEIQFSSDNLDRIKVLINGDPIGRFIDNRYNMPLEESQKIIKSMSEKLGLTTKETWETLIVYYQCDAAGYHSLRSKIFTNDANGDLVYSEEKKRLLFSNAVEEKFQILEQAIITLS